MSVPRVLYLTVYSVYIVFFALFLRFYMWREYTRKNFWQRRPTVTGPGVEDLCRRLGRQVPFVSILIPARNEADVIEKTIRHISELDYPKDRFEILVATDEKESLTARTIRKRVVTRLRRAIESRRSQDAIPQSREEREQFKVGLLYALSLLCASCADLDRVFETCRRAYENPKSADELFRNARDIEHICRGVFSLYNRLSGWETTSHGTPIGNIGEAPGNLGEDEAVLLSAAASRLKNMGKRRFAHEVYAILDRFFPTTQEILDKLMLEDIPDNPIVKHIVVPYDFDGVFGGRETGHPVPSTKGRALNWALKYLDPRSEICGFYDAESRPDPKTMAYVAYRSILDPEHSKIFQGPVFQVRNFYKMGLFCRIASLYQTVSHDWYLPWLFKTLPFVGGTNVYIDRRLIEAVGGWDHLGLTEDLEFGTRAYLQAGVWPEYLPYPSSEQTPPSYKAFFRQRLRWATGLLQVVNKVDNMRYVPEDRRRNLLARLIFKGPVEWVLCQLATLVPLVSLVLQYRQLLDATVVPAPARWLLTSFSSIYFLFTFSAFARYRPYFDTAGQPNTFVGNIKVLLGLLIQPVATFLFPTPFTSSLVLMALGKEPKTWAKTPRTRERAV